MATLLTLPPELRLKIYQYAVSHEPETINIDIHEKEPTPQGLTTAITLCTIDTRLSEEIFSLFWQTNTFSTCRIGPQNYRSSQRVYRQWLHESVGVDAAKYLRYLRFNEFGTPNQIRQPGHSCVDVIEVDLREGSVSVFDFNGGFCLCSHADYMRSVMQDCLPRAVGVKWPTVDVLWKLYDHWYRSCAMVKHLRMSDADVQKARENVDASPRDGDAAI